MVFYADPTVAVCSVEEHKKLGKNSSGGRLGGGGKDGS